MEGEATEDVPSKGVSSPQAPFALLPSPLLSRSLSFFCSSPLLSLPHLLPGYIRRAALLHLGFPSCGSASPRGPPHKDQAARLKPQKPCTKIKFASFKWIALSILSLLQSQKRILSVELFLPEFSDCHSFYFTDEFHMAFFQNREFLL